ncbi:MAG: CAP domain-containing protein [Planctomycetota bacterium]
MRVWPALLLLAPPAAVPLRPARLPSLGASAHLEAPGAAARAWSARVAGSSMVFVDLQDDGRVDAVLLAGMDSLLPLRPELFVGDRRLRIEVRGTREITVEAQPQRAPRSLGRFLHDLNAVRRRAGLHAVGWHDATRAACEAHAAYMERYPDVGVDARAEAKGWEGYSPAGNRVAASGVTLRTKLSRAMARVAGSYADRMALLDPYLVTLCGAVSRRGGVLVLDPVTGNARYGRGGGAVRGQPVRWPLSFPRPDSTGAPSTYSGWCVETHGRSWGCPVSLRLGPLAGDFEYRAARLTHESSRKKIACETAWPGAGFNRLGEGNRGGLALIPRRRLAAGWYAVEIRSVSRGRERTDRWRFKVGS